MICWNGNDDISSLILYLNLDILAKEIRKYILKLLINKNRMKQKKKYRFTKSQFGMEFIRFIMLNYILAGKLNERRETFLYYFNVKWFKILHLLHFTVPLGISHTRLRFCYDKLIGHCLNSSHNMLGGGLQTKTDTLSLDFCMSLWMWITYSRGLV